MLRDAFLHHLQLRGPLNINEPSMEILFLNDIHSVLWNITLNYERESLNECKI